MFFMRLLSRLFLTALLLTGLHAQAQGLLDKAGAAPAAMVQGQLLAHAPDGAAPGATVWVGLQLTHTPEWHTYWKNSGESGLPPELQLSLIHI